MTFTVAELRDLADSGGFTDRDDRIRQALTAYADRLEQDERILPKNVNLDKDVMACVLVCAGFPEILQGGIRAIQKRAPSEAQRGMLSGLEAVERMWASVMADSGLVAATIHTLVEKLPAALRETTPTP